MLSPSSSDQAFDEALARVRLRIAANQAAAEAKASSTPTQLFLPGFDIGAFPNHLNRSSLIAPIARGQRKFYRQAIMVTRRDCVLEYTGEQLDEGDGDVIMALIAFARPYPLGTSVHLNRKELLRKIKRGAIGSSQYQWLHRSLKRLREATLFLETKKLDGTIGYSIGKMTSFNIVQDLSYEDSAEAYCYTLDPRWELMFGNREYSLLDWEKRKSIRRGQDMAKTLQRLVSTSSNTIQRYSLDMLKSKMEYQGRMRDFRKALATSVEELERLQVVAKGKITTNTKGAEQLTLWLARTVV